MELAALAPLRDKYVELLALRVDPPSDPRARMRSLASRWPGALRELDELPLEMIEDRLLAVEAALTGEARVPRWVVLVDAFHQRTRAALALKRRFGRDLEAARRAVEGAPDAQEMLLIARLDLEEVLQPSGGRLSVAVLASIARDHGLSAEECALEAFPRSPLRCLPSPTVSWPARAGKA